MLPNLDFIGRPLIYTLTYLTLLTGFYILFIFLEHRKRFKPPKPQELPKVSVIVPVYNGVNYLKNCLNSLKNLDYPKNRLEIIVVDDGSTDNSYKEAKKFSEMKVLKKIHNGKARTINYGLSRAKGEIIGVLDCDSIVEREALKKMVGYFNEKNVGAIVSGIRVYKPKNFLEKFQEIEYMLTLFFRKNFSFVKGLFVTPGVLALYRKNILEEIGKFQDNITEDLEIALRILSRGYDIKCVPEARTYTQVPNKFKDLIRQRVRWNYGLISNLRNYTFLFSRKYKELGLFILPITLFTNFFLVIFFTYIIVNFVFHWTNNLYILSITGFETYIINLLNKPHTFNFLTSEFSIFMLITLIFAFTLMIYTLSTLEVKLKFRTILQYLIYLITSGYLYSYFWLMTLYKFLRKDIKW